MDHGLPTYIHLNVPSVYFRIIEHWCKAPVKSLTSLFRGYHGLFGLLLAALLLQQQTVIFFYKNLYQRKIQ